MQQQNFRTMSNALRILTVDAIGYAGSGHPGTPLGMADVATVLFSQILKQDPLSPAWPDRDRFVLSSGHGIMLLYALQHMIGYPHMTKDALRALRRSHSVTPGHPEHDSVHAIEATTGPLGQGLGNAVGMAVAEEMLRAEFGPELVNHYTYTMIGDGCLMEGISQEVISLAGHWGLKKLIVLFGDNKITIDGPVDIASSEDTLARFRACGWRVESIDGHNFEEIRDALLRAQSADAPSLIACRTIIGYGVPDLEGTEKVHGGALEEARIKAMRKALGWTWEEPFFVPEDICSAWKIAGEKHRAERMAWEERQRSSSRHEAFVERLSGSLPAPAREMIAAFRRKTAEAVSSRPMARATRQWSGDVLKQVCPAMPSLIGGAADLSESTGALASPESIFSRTHPAGRHIYYGVREHGMAAIMNGLALHGGVRPYGGTFFAFSDYMRPAIRLSAMMKQPVIYIFTHDSIGVGEDGPTHQPVEQLLSLRAIPELNVFRPADAFEVADCWELALNDTCTPSALCLSRQSVPSMRQSLPQDGLCARGAYVFSSAPEHEHHIDIWATGSEVALACAVQKRLAEDGLGVRVISVPCWRLFDQQPQRYRMSLTGAPVHKAVIEAGLLWGWERYVGADASFFGIETFGFSGSPKDLYAHFGLTEERIAATLKTKVRKN